MNPPSTATSPLPDRTWRRNLYAMWVAQASMAMGFSFFFPFIPLFVQELGVDDAGQAALWSGIAGGVGGFVMMFSGPFWGILGDRYGRKRNVLRGMFGSALVLALTALVGDVYQLVATRVLFGLLGGGWMAMMALASSMAPRDKVTYSIGVLQSASFLGFTIGPFVGGVLADSLGFRTTFGITGGLVAMSGLVVALLVVERFEKPAHQEPLGARVLLSSFIQTLQSRSVTSVILVILLVQMGAAIMMPVLPVFVATLSGSDSAAFDAGVAFSIMGLSAVISSVAIPRVSRRLGMGHTLVAAFVFAGLLYIPLFLIGSLTQLFIVIGFLGLCSGALNTIAFGLVGVAASRERLGAAYGMAQSAGSLGWGAGPALGGAVAALWGLREVFLVNSAVLLVTAVLAGRFVASGTLGARPKEPVEEQATAAGGARG